MSLRLGIRYLVERTRATPPIFATLLYNMSTEENPEPTNMSLADRITERVPDEEEMEIDEEAEGDRRQALLNGPLERPSAAVHPEPIPEGADEDEGEYPKGLLNRIAKNRLYTADETAPDAPATRVPTHVSSSFLFFGC